MLFFFKPCNDAYGISHVKKELVAFQKVASARIPPPPEVLPEVLICRLHGVVVGGED